MFRFLIPTLIVASVAITGSASSAEAGRWSCLTTVSKGGCGVVVYLPDNPKPKTPN